MGRVSKYKKLNSSDSAVSDKHDDGFKKVCKSWLFVYFPPHTVAIFLLSFELGFDLVMIRKYTFDM